MSRGFQALLLCALACGLLSSGSARAQDHSVLSRAEASFKAGAAAYAAGEYLAAIQALEAAYELTPLPAIAFSLAQAVRRHYFVARDPQHLQRAIALYRTYVAQVATGGRRADALDALSQLEPLAVSSGSAPVSEVVAAQPTRLMITSDAPGARITLDGAEPGPSPLIREVAPGEHQALVEAEGFFSARRALTALRGELILGEVPLQERPSTLIVATPASADLYIDGAFVREGGARVSLPLAAGTHRLAVAAKGARVVYRTLVLERGKTQTLRIDLSATPQRKASLGLFVAGGAALATGIVLGSLAVREEDRAQAFLEQQARANVTADQLESYHEHVSDRDLFRDVAAVSVASATLLFLTALLLRELDRPNPKDIQRDARTLPLSDKYRVSLLSAVRVAPVITTRGAGFALSDRF